MKAGLRLPFPLCAPAHPRTDPTQPTMAPVAAFSTQVRLKDYHL